MTTTENPRPENDELLFIKFLIDTARIKFGEKEQRFSISKRLDNASIHFEELDHRDGQVHAEFVGPIYLNVTADEHTEPDIFDFHVKSRDTGHLREAAFSLSRQELEVLITELGQLRDDLDRRKREQVEQSKIDQQQFEIWLKKHEQDNV